MGGGGGTTVDTNSEPWGPAREYVIEQLGLSQDRFNDVLEFFPGRTTPERSADTGLAFQLTRDLVTGNRASDAANDFIGQVAAGDFMPGAGNNPYLDETFDVMADRIGEKYNQIISPTINSRFASAGRSGSPAAGRARGRADETLARELGDLGDQIYFGEYERRMGDRFSAAQIAPGLDAAELDQIGSLAAVGASEEDYTQNLINEAIARFDFTQREPDTRLDAYIQRIRGSAGSFGTASQPAPGGNNTGAAIAGGASILSAIIGAVAAV